MSLSSRIKKIPLSSVFVSLGGIVIGLIIGFLLSIPIDKIPYDWSWAVSIGAYVVSVVLMVTLFLVGRDRIIEGFSYIWPSQGGQLEGDDSSENVEEVVEGVEEEIDWQRAYVLDTSAIIDGRIADIIRTGFVDGELVVPSFVLDELQQVADSSSRVKRNRGRRGLEILRVLKQEEYVPFRIFRRQLEGDQKVDSSLIDLASEKNAAVITTDFNLNRVGKVRGVKILNINELANMVKTVLVPGEEIEVEVIQEGKEEGQGVAYLPDGTMIVIEDGEDLVGEKVEVVVERLFQTEAGRIIFVRKKNETT